MKLTVSMGYKLSNIDKKYCEIEKVIKLSEDEFRKLSDNLLENNSEIAFSKNKMYIDDNDMYHCLLFVDDYSGDGILVYNEGYNYARYSAFVPKANILLQLNNHPYLSVLNDRLTEIADDIINKAAQFGEDYEFNLMQYINSDFAISNDQIIQMLWSDDKIEKITPTSDMTFRIKVKPCSKYRREQISEMLKNKDSFTVEIGKLEQEIKDNLENIIRDFADDNRFGLCLFPVSEAFDIDDLDERVADWLTNQFYKVEGVEDIKFDGDVCVLQLYEYLSDCNFDKKINKENFDVSLGKHLLWLNDAGGTPMCNENCLLESLNFSNLNLQQAKFNRAIFIDCEFDDTDLTWADLQNAYFDNCTFKDLRLDEVNLSGAMFDRCRFSNNTFVHSNFSDTKLISCDIDSLNLTNSFTQGMLFSDTPTSEIVIDGIQFQSEKEFEQGVLETQGGEINEKAQSID